jgi:hypothetical protein
MDSDADLASRVAALRELGGVGELRDNRLLREAATAHAERVCADGSVRHEVDGDDPEARLRRRHVVARVVGEVVARARTEDEAFDALLASPSHRRALVDRRFTDVCVGTARRGASLCVVIDLAAWAALLGPLRSARGLPEALTSRTSLAARTRGRRRSVANDAADPTTHPPDGRP